MQVMQLPCYSFLSGGGGPVVVVVVCVCVCQFICSNRCPPSPDLSSATYFVL